MIEAPGAAAELAGQWPPLPVEPTFAMIDKVTAVHVDFTAGEVPAAVISAIGQVRTGGWLYGMLAPQLSTDEARSDRVWDLLFLGRLPPKGAIVFQRITPISATLVTALPSWVDAVRVHGANGQYQVVNVKQPDSAVDKTLALQSVKPSGVDAFPW